MKKLIYTAVLVLVAAGFAACGNGNSPENKDKNVTRLPYDSATYVGSINFSGLNLEKVYLRVIDNPQSATGSLNFRISRLEVAPGTVLSIAADNIGYTESNNIYTLAANRVVPTINGQQMDETPLTNLSGSIDGNQLSISFEFGGMTLTYEGTFTTDDPNPGDPETKPVSWEKDYVGTLGVLYQGTVNDNENITIHLTAYTDNTAQLLFKQVKFVPQMPVTLDVIVPGVTLTANTLGCSLQGDQIIPLVGDTEYERYLVTDLTGQADTQADTLFLSLNFGSFPTTFRGSAR